MSIILYIQIPVVMFAKMFQSIIELYNNNMDYRCKCGECREERLVGALEYRCCHEVAEALGKLVFDASIERISCVTLHEDFEALINETVLRQVGPMLKDKQGQSYRCHSGTPVKE